MWIAFIGLELISRTKLRGGQVVHMPEIPGFEKSGFTPKVGRGPNNFPTPGRVAVSNRQKDRMKVPFAAIGTLLIVLSGCSDTSDTMPEGEMLALSLEEGVIVMEPDKQYHREGFSLRVDSVLNDSRCPVNALCVWAGDVEVVLDLELYNTRHLFSLHTNPESRRDTVIQGVRYALIDVSPYPGGTPIEYEDYRVTVSVGE